ncbi:hypothetical protein BH10CYA1_BH10CYA1_18360 [soil metagenome]
MASQAEQFSHKDAIQPDATSKASINYSDVLPGNSESLALIRKLDNRTSLASINMHDGFKPTVGDPLFVATTNINDEYDRFKAATDDQKKDASLLNLVGDIFIPFKGGSDMATYRIDSMDKSLAEHEILKEIRLLSPSQRASLPADLVKQLSSDPEFSDTTKYAMRTLLSQQSDRDYSRSAAIIENIGADLNRFQDAVKDQGSYTGILGIAADTVIPLKGASDMAWYRIQDMNRRTTENSLIKDLRLLSPHEREQLPNTTTQSLLTNPDFSDSARKQFAQLLSVSQKNDYSVWSSVAQNIQSDFGRFKSAVDDQVKDSSLLNVAADAGSLLNDFTFIPGVMKIGSDMATYRIDELERQRSQTDMIKQIRGLTKTQRAGLPEELRTELLSRTDFTDATQSELKRLFPSSSG